MVPEATMTIAAFERCTAKLLQEAMLAVFDPNSADNRNAAAKQKATAEQNVAVGQNVVAAEPPVEGREGGNGANKEHWADLALSYYAIMGGFRVIYRPDHTHADGIVAAQEGPQASPRQIIDREESSSVRAEGSGSMTAASDGRDEKDISPIAVTPQKPGDRRDSPSPRDTGTAPNGFLSSMLYGSKKKYKWPAEDGVTHESAGTLTPHGVLWMAKKGWLPLVSPETVRDKSKVNALAKALVCFQAAWMIIQALGRLATNQTVTLLELHTVLHTMCAGTMYLTVCCFLGIRDVPCSL